jgi:hypothetical protein
VLGTQHNIGRQVEPGASMLLSQRAPVRPCCCARLRCDQCVPPAPLPHQWTLPYLPCMLPCLAMLLLHLLLLMSSAPRLCLSAWPLSHCLPSPQVL